MKRIQDIPIIDRPREKLIALGPEALSDTELLAVLIGSGVKGKSVLSLSQAILRMIDKNPGKPDFTSLRSIEGIGSAKACQILAALEFSRRRFQTQSLVIQNSCDIISQISHISDKKQEYFLCISLNGANEILGNRVITVGLLHSTLVHPREVFADAISDRAASVMLAHNHPSGLLRPSRDDVAITKQMVEAGRILGIPILDHIIISKKGYFSFKDEGML